MVEYIAKVGEKYNDLTNDNVWLHRITNENQAHKLTNFINIGYI
jgi:hypothetical protein